MKKFKLWSGLGLAFIAVVTFSLSVFLAKPSDAVSVRNAQMIELGIIDEVKSAEDLGLGHLLRRPPQLVGGLSDNVYVSANDSTHQWPENISMAVPLGTNSPVRMGQLVNDTGDPRMSSNLVALGSVTPGGEVEPITPIQERGMFQEEQNNGGILPPKGTRAGTNIGSHETLVADASGSFLQARYIPVIDLIVMNRRNNRIFLVPRVVADAFCRDALNTAINRTQRPHNINLSHLRKV